MALSELAKAQNKAASLVRTRAHTARRKLYMQEMDRCETSTDVVQARNAADEASAEQEAHIARRNEAVAALHAQINKLEEQIAALQQSPEIDALSTKRKAAWNTWRSLIDGKKSAVEERFPDLRENGALFSASAWTPPAEVLAEMEKARANATDAPPKGGGERLALNPLAGT